MNSISSGPRDATDARGGSGQMFDRIADRYDLLNRILSLGVDESWRRRAVDALLLSQAASPRVLDLATGTGDLALQIVRRIPDVEVVGLDPSRQMLRVGQGKAKGKPISFVCGSAEDLPFEDASFDGCTMAFGIRNVPDRERALREIARVLRPGRRLAILELGEPREGLLGAPARFYVRRVVPFVGGLLSGQREYAYLAQSMAAFPDAATFGETIERCGLRIVTITPLMFGACHLFVAERASQPERAAR